MGEYRKCKDVTVDVLKAPAKVNEGVFLRDGKLYAGWVPANGYTHNVTSLVAMAWAPYSLRLLAATSSGKIYTAAPNGGNALELQYSDGNSSPFCFETTYDNLPFLVLVSGNKFTAFASGISAHNDFPGNLSCGVMHKGRLFGAANDNGYMIKWSGRGDFYDWDESASDAGNVILEPHGGAILRILEFEGELIVFRQRLIVRFSASGDPLNFKVKEQIPVPPVVKNAVVAADDSILFFTDSGLMRYRGGKVTPIKGAATDDLTAVTSAHVGLGRYLFIAGASKSLERKVIYVYDTLYDVYQLIDRPAEFVSEDKAGLLFYTDTHVYRLYHDFKNVRYTYTSDKIDFGSGLRKLIKEAEIDCDSDVTATLYVDGAEVRVLNGHCGKIKLNVRGREFHVTFRGSYGSVRAAKVTAEVPE